MPHPRSVVLGACGCTRLEGAGIWSNAPCHLTPLSAQKQWPTPGAPTGKWTEIPAPPTCGGEEPAFPGGRRWKHWPWCLLLPHLSCIPKIRDVRTREGLELLQYKLPMWSSRRWRPRGSSYYNHHQEFYSCKHTLHQELFQMLHKWHHSPHFTEETTEAQGN